MRHLLRFMAILITCLSLTLFTAGAANTVSAAEKNPAQVTQNIPATVSGKVSAVFSAGGFIYAEVDTGSEKVWAAGPSSATTIDKDDTIAFTTEMPMRNFHSKGLDRDFSLIYFVREFITDKDLVGNAAPRIPSATQQHNNAVTKSSTRDEVRVGEYLREASLDGLNVETTKLSSFRGKPLIINLWASYCGPCRAEMGSLERLSRKYGGKAFNIIGITIDDYRDKAEALIRETGITFANFQDHNLHMENMLGGNFIPLTVLVDEHGRILKKVDGVREWDDPGIIAAIEQVFQVKFSQ